MKKKPILERIGDFMEGKGFYIVLFLCVAAIGISGYYLFSSLDMRDGDAAVAAPTQGQVVADYSLEVLAYDETMGDWRTHSGIDIAAPVGTQVLAVSAGTVASVEQDDLMGTTVVIAHAGGVESIYANLAAVPTVEAGDQVSIGAVIGAVGTTAVAESARAPHLHFEMREDGESVDPVSYLPE